MSVGEGKMVKSRRPLGSLAAYCNVEGEESLRRRVGPETTPVQRHTNQMYQRWEETWRSLTRQRVAAFLRLFVLCLVETENGLPLEALTYKLLKKTLRKRVIPWIHHRLVYTMNKEQWPITLAQFRVVDQYLADHLPLVQKDDAWASIAYFLKKWSEKGKSGGELRNWRGRKCRPTIDVWLV